jgi:polyisoprenoid-binding protein YceI
MAWEIDSAHTNVQFAVRHMAISTVRGSFERVQGSLEMEGDTPTRFQATIDAASINTNEPQRDTHLRSADFLHTEAHPEIRFVSTKVEPIGGGRFRVFGDLTIRGATHPVTLTAEDVQVTKDPRGNRRVGMVLTGSVNRKDWNLTWNVVLEAGSLMVGEDVRITIDLEAVEKAAVPA